MADFKAPAERRDGTRAFIVGTEKEGREIYEVVYAKDAEAAVEAGKAALSKALGGRPVFGGDLFEVKPFDGVPVIGLGATYGIGSDRYAGTIIAVSKSGKTVTWVGDRPRVVKGSGHDGSASYVYERSDAARAGEVYTLRHNGYFFRKGSPATYGALCLGYRAEYRDPHF